MVLVGRGTCLFATKFQNIAAKGGKYVLVYNSAASITYVETDVAGQQAASLTRDDGLYLKQQINNGVKVSLDFSNSQIATIKDTATGGLMSILLDLRPHLRETVSTRPPPRLRRANILSTLPDQEGAYAILSGTSMATPFMSGSIAVFPGRAWKVLARCAQQHLPNTAAPLMNDTTSNLYETVAKQGTGHGRRQQGAVTSRSRSAPR